MGNKECTVTIKTILRPMLGLPKNIARALVLFNLAVFSNVAQAVFINEIHYDNAGADVGEAVELVGDSATDLAGWALLFYNGSNGKVYRSVQLSGVFGESANGKGVLSFAVAPIQNSVEAIALVDDNNVLLQFLSYEGVVTGVEGPATGITSTDIGVSENGNTALGSSLQLKGSGESFNDFNWQVGTSSFGQMNDGQIFQSTHSVNAFSAVSEPGLISLVLFGLTVVLFGRFRTWLWPVSGA